MFALHAKILARTEAAADVGAVWVFTSPEEAKEAQRSVKLDNPKQRVSVLRRTVSAGGASFFIYCMTFRPEKKP
jgi:hypothetical protein